jgi:hypothetical protein
MPTTDWRESGTVACFWYLRSAEPYPTAKVHGTIKQRRLMNYRVDPVMMERLLPDHDTT